MHKRVENLLQCYGCTVFNYQRAAMYMQVQAMIGASRSLAFDLTAACSGFVVGLVTGAQFIRTRQYRNVLVIGADALSRYVDWRDRGELHFCLNMVHAHMAIEKEQYQQGLSYMRGLLGRDTCNSVGCSYAGTCILFGDACGAVVLTAQEGECSLLGSSMQSDGNGQKHLKVDSLPPTVNRDAWEGPLLTIWDILP